MGCLHNQPFLTGYIIKKYTISGGRLQPRRRRTTKFVYFAALPRRFTLWSAPPLSHKTHFAGVLWEPSFSGISDVYLFTFSLTFSFLPSANLLAFSVRIPYAVGATPCGRPNQWKNFHFAAVRRRLLSPASNHAPFRLFCSRPICSHFCAYSARRRGDPIVGARPNLFTSRLCREDSLYGRRLLFPTKRTSLAFCGSPLFPVSLMYICSLSALPSRFYPRPICSLFLCVFPMP